MLPLLQICFVGYKRDCMLSLSDPNQAGVSILLQDIKMT